MRGVSTTPETAPPIPEPVPAASATPALDPGDARAPELSYFFPAHDEAENIEGLVVRGEEVAQLRDARASGVEVRRGRGGRYRRRDVGLRR